MFVGKGWKDSSETQPVIWLVGCFSSGWQDLAEDTGLSSAEREWDSGARKRHFIRFWESLSTPLILFWRVFSFSSHFASPVPPWFLISNETSFDFLFDKGAKLGRSVCILAGWLYQGSAISVWGRPAALALNCKQLKQNARLLSKINFVDNGDNVCGQAWPYRHYNVHTYMTTTIRHFWSKSCYKFQPKTSASPVES